MLAVGSAIIARVVDPTFAYSLLVEVFLGITAATTLLICSFYVQSRTHRLAYAVTTCVVYALSATLGTTPWPAGLGDPLGYLMFVILAYAGVSFPASLVWLIAVGWLLSHVRRFIQPGECPTCGYDLRGLTEPRCPECGCATKSLGKEDCDMGP